MKIAFEKDTKENRIADIKHKFACKQISKQLFRKALTLLEAGKRLIYYVDSNNNYRVRKFVETK